MNSDTRTIRADIRAERTTVNELDRNLTSGYLKTRLREASDLLNDVEGWLANPIDRRTAVDSATWLDFVDSIIEVVPCFDVGEFDQSAIDLDALPVRTASIPIGPRNGSPA
jgi:hypothetical protein